MQSAEPDDKLWYASHNEDRLRRPPKVMRLPRQVRTTVSDATWLLILTYTTSL
jgi:hypothetical protein